MKKISYSRHLSRWIFSSVLMTLLFGVLIFNWLDLFSSSLSQSSIPLKYWILCLFTGISMILSFLAVSTLQTLESSINSTSFTIFLRFSGFTMSWSTIASFSSIIFLRLQNGSESCHYIPLEDCYIKSQLPVECSLCLLFAPSILYFSFPSIRWWNAILSYIAAVVVVIVAASISERATNHIVINVSMLLLSAFTLRQTRESDYSAPFVVNGQEELNEFGAKLRSMISGIAHDLKSPLAALILGLETFDTMMKEAENFHKQQPSHKDLQEFSHQFLIDLESVMMIMQSSKKSMLITINRCVDFNQASSGIALIPNMQVTDLFPMVDLILSQLTEQYSYAKIIKEFDDSLFALPEIMTDQLWLEENLYSLMTNAMKYVDSNEPLVMLYITQQTHNRREYVKFYIIDEGMGINSGMEKTLFTFYGHSMQVHNGGSGLGLYTLACRIKALKGNYGYIPNNFKTFEEVESCGFCALSTLIRDGPQPNRPVHGSIFWFEIPMRLAATHVDCGSNEASAAENVPKNSVLTSAIPGLTFRSTQVRKGTKQTNRTTNAKSMRSAFISPMGSSLSGRVRINIDHKMKVEASIRRAETSLRRTAANGLDGNVRVNTKQSDGTSASPVKSTRHSSTTNDLSDKSNRQSKTGTETIATAPTTSNNLVLQSIHCENDLTKANTCGMSPHVPLTIHIQSSSTSVPQSRSHSEHNIQSLTSSMTSGPSVVIPGTPRIHTPAHRLQKLQQLQADYNAVESALGHQIVTVDMSILSELKEETKLISSAALHSAPPLATVLERQESITASAPTTQRFRPAGLPSIDTSVHVSATSGDVKNLETPDLKMTSVLSCTKESQSDGQESHQQPKTTAENVVVKAVENSNVDTKPHPLALRQPSSTNSPTVVAVAAPPAVSKSVIANVETSRDTPTKPSSQNPGDQSSSFHHPVAPTTTMTMSLPKDNLLRRLAVNILVVDDSLPIRKMCTMILQKQGYKVTSAVNGKEALKMMTAWFDQQLQEIQSNTGKNPDVVPYDIVLMDIQMPVMDGIEAVTLYRQAELEFNNKMRAIRNPHDAKASSIQPATSTLLKQSKGIMNENDDSIYLVNTHTSGNIKRKQVTPAGTAVSLAEAANILAQQQHKQQPTSKRQHSSGENESNNPSARRSVAANIVMDPNGVFTYSNSAPVSLRRIGMQQDEDVKHKTEQNSSESDNEDFYLTIIAMSACSDFEIIEQALEVGMTCFMPKPFTIQQFHSVVKELGLEV